MIDLKKGDFCGGEYINFSQQHTLEHKIYLRDYHDIRKSILRGKSILGVKSIRSEYIDDMINRIISLSGLDKMVGRGHFFDDSVVCDGYDCYYGSY